MAATAATQRVISGARRLLSVTASSERTQQAIMEASRTKQTGISLQTLLQFGKQAHDTAMADTLLTSAKFLARELPIRFAHRIVELDNLPHGLSQAPSIRRVSEWYKRSFEDIVEAPVPTDARGEEAFTALLGRIFERHNPTLVFMAKGIFEFRRSVGVPFGHPMPAAIEDTVHNYLDVFFTSRVGIRTLISQHLTMHQPRPHYVGIINTQTRPGSVIQTAIDDARAVCERVYGEVPTVEVVGDVDFVFSYVPAYLHHIMFELLKNSSRAVVEKHGRGTSGRMPPIKIILSASADSEDVVIKISDEGGGIPRSGMRRIFSYFYTTAPPQFTLDNDEGPADFSREQPMAGLGVGLPLSRVFARYFGGDLQIISMEGYGTDAYLFLRRLGDAREPLSECGTVTAGNVFAAGHGATPASAAAAAAASHGLESSPAPAAQPSIRISLKRATTGHLPPTVSAGGSSGPELAGPQDEPEHAATVDTVRAASGERHTLPPRF